MSVSTVKKWGNSAAVRIPASVMDAAQLSLEQPVRVRAMRGKVVIEPASVDHDLDALLDAISPANLPHPRDLDTGTPRGKEVW